MDVNSALRVRLVRELAQRLLPSGFAYALFAGLYSLSLSPNVRAAALCLSTLLALAGAGRTLYAHRVVHGRDVERSGVLLIWVAALQSLGFGTFVAYAMWNVRGHAVLECLLMVGVAGTSSVSANLFAPFPALDWFNICAQVLPIYVWSALSVPRFGWLLPCLTVIHAVAVTQSLRINSTHLRSMFLTQISLEAQSEDLRQARDAAQAADAAKTSFLANMSHEIRTPLNGIMGLAEVLQAADMAAEQKVLVSDIAQSGEHLLSILNDILDMAKVTSGKLSLERLPFDLARLVRDVAAPAAALAEARQLDFRLELPAEVPVHVEGDSVRVRQVLSNLLSNAVKFTSAGEIGFAVAVPRPGWIHCEVSDTGIGLSLEQQAGLFQEFHQVDSSTTRRFGGTGLGLAISYRLVELMGGRLWVESRLGEGSTFLLELPLAAAEKTVRSVRAEPVETAAIRAGMRVLVVEDNVINQKVTVSIATRAGAHVEIAENGREAVERHQASPYDLILMDCQMPELDGYQATARIRGLEGAAARVRIIGVTANAFREDRERCLRAGMDGYVAKPLTSQSLLEAMAGVGAV